MNIIAKHILSIIISVLFVSRLSAQVDTIFIKKEYQPDILFSSISGKTEIIKISMKELVKSPKLEVNDTIMVTSYWFTCHSGGLQHSRYVYGNEFWGDVLRDIGKLGIGGKAYFTEVKGKNKYSPEIYDIFGLEIEITKD